MHTRLTVLVPLLLLVSPTPAAAQRAKQKTLTVAPAGKVQHLLRGAAYYRLTSARVVTAGRRPRAVPGVVARLGRNGRKGRTLTVEAAASARPATGLVVQGLQGRKVALTLPVTVDVVASDEPAPKTAPDSGKTSGEKNKRAPDRLELAMSAGTERTIQLNRRDLRGLDAVRTAPTKRRRAPLDLTLARTRKGASITVRAPKHVEAGQTYALQGRSHRRWRDLPVAIVIHLELKDVKDARIGGKAIRAMPRGGTIRFADGTVGVLGPVKHRDAGEGSDAVVVKTWAPKRVGLTSGRLVIEGVRLPANATVKIGQVTLAIEKRNLVQIVAKLPASSSSCPPGKLVISSADPAFSYTLEDRYWVKGDEAFHHMYATATQHKKINAFLLGLASQHVYENNWGHSSHEGWSKKFERHYKTLGFEEVATREVKASGVDTQFAVAVNPELLLIVFRGSEGIGEMSWEKLRKDWLATDLGIDRKSVSSWKSGAKVHLGFYNALEEAWPKVKGLVATMRDAKQPVAICGHSLGGALAVLCAYRLKRELGITPTMVYTYGSPRVGNLNWKSAYLEAGLLARTHRYHNANDPVPTFPTTVGGWVHVGVTHNIGNGDVVHDASEDTSWAPLSGALTQHGLRGPGGYLQPLHGELTSAQRKLVPRHDQ